MHWTAQRPATIYSTAHVERSAGRRCLSQTSHSLWLRPQAAAMIAGALALSLTISAAQAARMPKALAVQLAEQSTSGTHGLTVKFREGSGVHMENGRFLIDALDRDDSIRRALDAVLRELASSRITLRPAISAAPGELLALKSRYSRRERPLADLRNYMQGDLSALAADQRAVLIRSLNAHALIEVAYLDPADSPGPWSLNAPASWPHPSQDKPFGASPLLVQEQAYLRAAPLGIGALKAWNQHDAIGAGVAVLLYDNGIRGTHEDLPDLFRTDMNNPVPALYYIDHGTAAMSVVAAEENGIGVSGIAHGASAGFVRSRVLGETHADRILEGVQTLVAGDVLLLEVGREVPALGFDCADNPTQANQVPLEFYDLEFDTIQTLVAQGITVVQGAGNGCVDLDSAIFQQMFSKDGQHSGAILVGAADSGVDLATPFAAKSYTSFGQRVDLYAWADNVAAASYTGPACEDDPNEVCADWLYFEGDKDRKYVKRFRGTSSAAAIVAGAAAVLQGKWMDLYGAPLQPHQVRDFLWATGTAQGGDAQARPIGRMPDLDAALQFIAP